MYIYIYTHIRVGRSVGCLKGPVWIVISIVFSKWETRAVTSAIVDNIDVARRSRQMSRLTAARSTCLNPSQLTMPGSTGTSRHQLNGY